MATLNLPYQSTAEPGWEPEWRAPQSTRQFYWNESKSSPLFTLFNGQLKTALDLGRDSSRPVASHKKVGAVTGLHIAAYTGTLLVLNEAWYKNYPKTSFQTFDDSREWLQVDKVGHAWSAYQLGRASTATWAWAGMDQKTSAWLGAGSGFLFQTVVEILDGHSAEWGWSWSDIAANFAGSALFLGQELGWQEQRIAFKFSFHTMTYGDVEQQMRADELFGTSLPERMLKDYNGQTYWLSTNIRSFFPNSRWPAWLNIAVGYGANGMLGAEDNTWLAGDGTPVDRTDVPRQRQWYLAPDVDFTRIKTNHKWLKTAFFLLNAIKLPAPTLVLQNGSIKVNALYF